MTSADTVALTLWLAGLALDLTTWLYRRWQRHERSRYRYLNWLLWLQISLVLAVIGVVQLNYWHIVVAGTFAGSVAWWLWRNRADTEKE